MRIRDEAFNFIQQHVYNQIDEHKATFDNENIRDFIDLYVQAKTNEQDNEIFTGKRYLTCLTEVVLIIKKKSILK